MADDDLTKGAEPSRWHTNTPGHSPSYSGHKLRRLAAAGRGEIQAHAIAVAKLFRTEGENRTGSQPRHVVTLEDVTHGLGLEAADAMRVQKLVNETLPTFSQKTQTQRIFHARSALLSVMRDSMTHVPSDARDEVLRRAVAYWKRHHQTDYGKAPTVRFGGGAMRKSMEPIPVLTVDALLSKAARGGKYYRRVPKPGGGYRYYYTREAYQRAHKKDGGGHLHGPEQLSLFNGDKGKPKPKANTQPKRPEESHTKAPAEVTPDSAMIRAIGAYQAATRGGDASKLRALAQDIPTLEALQQFAAQNRNRPKQLAKLRTVLGALTAIKGKKTTGEPGAAAEARARAKAKRTARRTSAGVQGAPPGGWSAADRVPPRNAAEARGRAAGVLGAKLGQLEKEGFEAVAAPQGMKLVTSEALGPLPGVKVKQLLDEGVTLVKRPQAKQEGLESTGLPQAATARQDGPKDGAGGRVLSEEMKSQLASVRPKQEILVDGTRHRVERLIGGNRGFGGLQTMTLHLKSKTGRKAMLTVPAGSSEARYSTSSEGPGQAVSVSFPEPETPSSAPATTGPLRSLSPAQMVGKWKSGGGTPWHVRHGPGGEKLPEGMSFKTKREATAAAEKQVVTWHASRDLPLPEGMEDYADLYQKFHESYADRGFHDAPTGMVKKPDGVSTMQIQQVGRVPSKLSTDLEPGDSTIWNSGVTYTVQKVRKISPKTFEVTMTNDAKGTEWKKKMRTNRYVPLNPDRHAMRKSLVRAAYEPLLGEFPRFVVWG